MSDDASATIPIRCRCGHTQARATPALTRGVPGYPDGLPYFVHTCLRCGAEYPCLSAAKVALRSGFAGRVMPPRAMAARADAEPEPGAAVAAAHEALRRFLRGSFAVPVPAHLPVSLLLGESEPTDMSRATIQYLPGPFTVPQTPPAGEG